jgi:hypothetical protein
MKQKRTIFLVLGIVVLLIIGALGYHDVQGKKLSNPTNVSFQISQDFMSLESSLGAYQYTRTADNLKPDEVSADPIGKTQHGDTVYALKNDPSHNQLVVVLNRSNPPHLLYSRKSK